MVWFKSATMAFNLVAGQELKNGHEYEGFLVTTKDIQPGEEILWRFSVSQGYRTVDTEKAADALLDACHTEDTGKIDNNSEVIAQLPYNAEVVFDGCDDSTFLEMPPSQHTSTPILVPHPKCKAREKTQKKCREGDDVPKSPSKEHVSLLKDAEKFHDTLRHQNEREQQLLSRNHPYCTSVGHGIGKHILGQGVVGGCLICIKYQNDILPSKRKHAAKVRE
jgi:hypothetical protein